MPPDDHETTLRRFWDHEMRAPTSPPARFVVDKRLGYYATIDCVSDAIWDLLARRIVAVVDDLAWIWACLDDPSRRGCRPPR